MSKTLSGFIMLSGIMLVFVGWNIGVYAGNQVGPPSTDLYYDSIGYAGGVVGLIGIGMFFFGAMRFSRGN